MTEVLTAAHIELTGVSGNDTDGSELRYYIVASPEAGDADDLRSDVFSPSEDGKHTWDNVIFPVDGTWDLVLHDASDDSTVHSDTLTVEAAS